MKKIFLILAILLSYTNSYSQYTGGVGDGSSNGNEISISKSKIRLEYGWNLISVHSNINGFEIDKLIQNLKTNNNIVIIKQFNEIFTFPCFGIDSIKSMDYKNAYFIFAQQPDSLEIIGKSISNSINTVDLQVGWNLIPYLKNNPMLASKALSSIIPFVKLLQKQNGEQYIPPENINTLEQGTTLSGMMIPGNGYIIYVSQPCVLSYPAFNDLYVTDPALITTNSAQINGVLSFCDYSTTICFEFGIDTNYLQSFFFHNNPFIGDSLTNISYVVSGLQPGTEYHYRLKAVNSLDTFYTKYSSFTTLGHAPIALASSATNITTTSAKINGSVDAGWLPTTVKFEYGTNENYGQIINAVPNVFQGDTITNVYAQLTGLVIGNTYHYRIIAYNAIDTTYSNDIQFTVTPLPPAATTVAVTDLGAVNKTLNATVNANGLPTQVSFELGTTSNYGQTIQATTNSVSGILSNSVNAIISNLSPGVVYHYRIRAENSLGVSYGNDMQFTHHTYGESFEGGLIFHLFGTGSSGLISAPSDQSTGAEWGCLGDWIPTATRTAIGTGMANSIDIKNYCTTPGIAADICLNLDLNGFTDWFLPSKYELQAMGNKLFVNGYGGFTATNYWSSTESTVSNAYIFSFYSGYLYQTNKNSSRRVRAARTFYPAITDSASNITGTSAIFKGKVNPRNSSTIVYFEYGANTSYGQTVTATQSPLVGGTNQSCSVQISGLIPGVVYHYRIVATNEHGTDYGNDVQFTAHHNIGDPYAGGIIFYIDSTGLSGLVCSESNQSNDCTWGCVGTSIIGADSTVIGSGFQNTQDICNNCSTSNIGARLCNDLVNNGYSDWYLPSKDELNLMYNNLKVNGIGNFSSDWYLSSSEVDANTAWGVYFESGFNYASYKGLADCVRAIRNF